MPETLFPLVFHMPMQLTEASAEVGNLDEFESRMRAVSRLRSKTQFNS